MAAVQRNTEIWSTRLQRELLALTTDNAPADTKEEIQGVLPPFITVKEHELNIESGTCAVSFLVNLPVSKTAATAAKKDETEKTATEEEGGEASKEEETTTLVGEPAPIIVALYVSLGKKSDGTVDELAVAYPFLQPVAILTSGSARFPEGSTIEDGDPIDIEMDWTPSLHLTDAILNIGLKIKESILQDEPFHPSADKETQDPVEEIVNQARRFGGSINRGLRSFASKAVPPPLEEGASPKKEKKGFRLIRKKKKEEKKKEKPKANSGEIRIGDEINMLEAPWVDCQGVYSCKAIRRPPFVDDAMAVAAQSQEARGEQVRSSVFEAGDDGEIPDNVNDYMRLQAGSMGQVCAVHAPNFTTRTRTIPV
jgi:hypothetical protein